MTAADMALPFLLAGGALVAISVGVLAHYAAARFDQLAALLHDAGLSAGHDAARIEDVVAHLARATVILGTIRHSQEAVALERARVYAAADHDDRTRRARRMRAARRAHL